MEILIRKNVNWAKIFETVVYKFIKFDHFQSTHKNKKLITFNDKNSVIVKRT